MEYVRSGERNFMWVKCVRVIEKFRGMRLCLSFGNHSLLVYTTDDRPRVDIGFTFASKYSDIEKRLWLLDVPNLDMRDKDFFINKVSDERTQVTILPKGGVFRIKTYENNPQ